MLYGIQPGYAKRAHVSGETPRSIAGRDKRETRLVPFPPELVQAADALGLKPGTLLKRLQKSRKVASPEKIAALAAHFTC